MAKKINTEETPQTDNNNIPAPEAQAVPVPETASENLGTGGETEDRLPAKTAGKGNAGSEETTEPHILSLLKKFPAVLAGSLSSVSPPVPMFSDAVSGTGTA